MDYWKSFPINKRAICNFFEEYGYYFVDHRGKTINKNRETEKRTIYRRKLNKEYNYKKMR